MLESLRLLNYKTHTESSITFETVTGLVGDIGTGKTGLIEALTSAVYGRGFPREMLHTTLSGKTMGEGEIEVLFTDKRRLLITRKGAAQKVRMQAADGSVQVYEGVQGLAAQVQEFTGFKEIKETGGSLVLTPQYRALDDPPFGLVHGAPKTIAAALTSLSSAMVYTQAQGVLSREITQAKAAEGTLRTQVERLEQEHAADLAALDVEAVQQRLLEVKEANERYQEKEAQLEGLRAVARSFRALRTAYKEAQLPAGLTDQLSDAWDTMTSVIEAQNSLTAVEDAVDEVESQTLKLKKLDKEITDLQKDYEEQKRIVADLRAKEPDLCPTCGRPLEVV